VNKKVDGQRKRKPEKKHKGESRYRKSTNGKVKRQKEKRKMEELPGELGIKEKRQEKEEEEACLERKVHIGSKWWKIMRIYSKEVKTTRRRVDDAVKENREEECMLMGGDFNGRIGERGARNWEEEEEGGGMGKENPKNKVENADGMDPRKWMGSVER
jgi:hypothetical protein